jgi:hypothetical protein
MATANLPPTTAKSEIKIVSHSGLFYWWPVWAVGFLLAILTAVENRLLAVVPHGTKLLRDASGKLEYLPNPDAPNEPTQDTLAKRDVLVAPQGTVINADPHLHMTNHKSYGVVFVTVLLLVIAITNIPMRGLWSVIVIVVIISAVIILALLGAWEHILGYLYYLDIRINIAGYVLISGILFGLWLVIFLFFDQQVYMVFTPGQLRLRLAIGEGETAYDTRGMTLEKQRSDLFRHWILGLGSGDLIVRTAGAQAHQFDLHNVLFVGRRLREIEEMMRSQAVVAGQSR